MNTLTTPLFPLQAVLFPDGLLELKIFEARYLDLIGRCLRESSSFGVVTLHQGLEVKHPGQAPVRFSPLGTLAELIEVDSEQPGILRVRCRGGARFRVHASEQRADGLWLAQTEAITADAPTPPGEEARAACIAGLRDAIDTLRARGLMPFLEPHRFDEAGWVANRWCELLPIPQAEKLRLLALADPVERLAQVDALLHGQPIAEAVDAGDGDVRPLSEWPEDDGTGGTDGGPLRH